MKMQQQTPRTGVSGTRAPARGAPTEGSHGNAAAAEALAGSTAYVVRRGDSLWKIAEAHYGDGSRWPEIREANQLASTTLSPGDRLVVPGASGGASATYAVQRGDSLWRIAERELGDGSRWPELQEENALRSTALRVGQQLRIPRTEAVVEPPSTGAEEPEWAADETSPVAPETSPRPQPRPQPQPEQDGEARGEAEEPSRSEEDGAQEPAVGEGETASTEAEQGVSEEWLQRSVDAALEVVKRRDRERARSHVEGILRQCARARMTNSDQVAYVLATADHESGFGDTRFSRSESLVEDHNPFRERGGQWSSRVHTHGRTVTADSSDALLTEYWDSAYGHKLGNRPGTRDGRDFRGRGYVQLTGRDNYERMSRVLGEQGMRYELDGQTWGEGGKPIDLAAHPDHVNRQPEVAAAALVEGSRLGLFTGRSLDDYIDEDGADFRNARRVINGTDAAAKIAGIAEDYSAVLRGIWDQVFVDEAEGQTPAPAPGPPAQAAPVQAAPTQEAPAQEAPTQEPPDEEAPVQESPAREEAPVLQGSVGARGRNEAADVETVQRLLNRQDLSQVPLTVDGLIGPNTIGAIRSFQKGIGFSRPDGRVDPGGRTMAALARS